MTRTPRPGLPIDRPAKTSVDSGTAKAITHVPTPDTLRGLYVSHWAALGRKFPNLIGVANKTEVNALVIDVKDDRGYVLYHSSVPLAHEIGADTADGHVLSRAKIRARLDTMIAHNIYPIARIVVAKDPILARKKLDLAIKRKSDLKPWLDKHGNPWLDPHQRVVWQYAVDLANEAYDLGFSEVQLDYVRFPDEKRLATEAVYPLANGRTRDAVIREQLGFVRDQLKPRGMRMTADVFGSHWRPIPRTWGSASGGRCSSIRSTSCCRWCTRHTSRETATASRTPTRTRTRRSTTPSRT